MSDYTYDAVVKSVHDGDTVTLDMDLGLDVHLSDFKVRLAGINAPELPTPEGKAAREFLAALLPAGTAILVDTVKDRQEKYGRYLGVLRIGANPSMTGKLPVMDREGKVSVNDYMVLNGYAKPYSGKGPKPV